MDGGFPFARLAAALVLSLTAHLLVAWGLSALPGVPGGEPGGAASDALRARLLGTETVAQAGTSRRGAAGTGSSRAAARYLPAAELDVRPQIMTHVNPEYPPELVAGIRGRVVLELYIAQNGTLDRIRVARAEPPGRFEASAVKAFTGARFTPGMKKGKPVPSLVRIELTYGD